MEVSLLPEQFNHLMDFLYTVFITLFWILGFMSWEGSAK